MLSKLHISELRSIQANAPLMPVLEPTSASSELLSCPVCLELKAAVAFHTNCMRLVCIDDILQLIDSNNFCPLCRGRVVDTRHSDITEFVKPPPIIQHLFDNIDYECNTCCQTLKYTPAITHHQVCPGERPHQPPAYLPPRGSQAMVRREGVSNPVSGKREHQSFDRVKLLVIHHNGRQIVSKCFRKNQSASDVKNTISNISGADVSSIKLFKFAHREINDSETVKNFSATTGATYISAFSNEPNLTSHTANIIIQELGPPPQVERDGWNIQVPFGAWN